MGADRMNSTLSFWKELAGRIILIVLAAYSYFITWWLPIIVAPFFWQLWDILTGRHSRITEPISKLLADLITHLLWAGYIIYSIVSFGYNIDQWYGWLFGIIVGLVIAQLLGLLWPHRWHLETMQGNF
jgi:hypothetical protein